MDAHAALTKLVDRVRGQRVTHVRINLYALEIFIAAHEADSPQYVLRCEARWHVRTAVGIITGSGVIETPSSYADAAEVTRASATIVAAGDAARTLVGRSLDRVEFDAPTMGLQAKFSGEATVATFLDDPADVVWVFRDPDRTFTMHATSTGLALGEPRR